LQKDDYQASARNKLIVEAFYLTGDIEKYGTGYHRIRSAIKEYPTMKFEFREAQGGYLVELGFEHQKETDIIPDNVPVNIEYNLNDRVKLIVDLIKVTPKISLSELANLYKVNIKTIKRDIKDLREAGLIIRHGAAKNGYWEIL